MQIQAWSAQLPDYSRMYFLNTENPDMAFTLPTVNQGTRKEPRNTCHENNFAKIPIHRGCIYQVNAHKSIFKKA